MTTIHFLNVKEGDCTIIQHDSGRCSMIDVCNARKPNTNKSLAEMLYGASDSSYASKGTGGNYNMKEHPTNPFEYMKKINEHGLFRFILTHPDMDHMDGIKDIFEEFHPANFWDTDNDKKMEDGDFGEYREEDWDFYKSIRVHPNNGITVLKLQVKAHGPYYNENADNTPGGDGLFILSPSKGLIEEIKKTKNPDYNALSYVLLLKAHGKRVVFGGDSSDLTWQYILNDEKLTQEISNIDILIAPHHGRKTGGDDDNKFLDVLKPTLTLFGNAKSQYLNYSAWSTRKLEYITNNQAGDIIISISNNMPKVYVHNETFANDFRSKRGWSKSQYNGNLDAWFICCI